MKACAETLYRQLQGFSRKWRQISRATEGEHTPEDVLQVAFLMAFDGTLPDFDVHDPDQCHHLFARVRNQLVKYAEKNCRWGARLDHAPQDGEGLSWAERLPSAMQDPMEQWLLAEEAVTEPDPVEVQLQCLGNSRLAAFLWLLRGLNTTRRQAAATLLMSRSWLWVCLKRAQAIHATGQLSLLDDESLGEDLSRYRTWRPFRIVQPVRPGSELVMSLRLDGVG